MQEYADTIYALSSGAPPSGIAIVRMSGRQTRFGLETLIGHVPSARSAQLVGIRNREKLFIDRGLALFFESPRSFTGEDCAELHVHGGRAVIAALLSALDEIEGFRPAEPGEFARRAFENGRMDLTEIEGLADLIAADTEMQRRLALENASGGLSAIYDAWSARLTRCRARIEADLDFVEEEDVPVDAAEQALSDLIPLRDEIAAHLERGRTAEIVRDGYRIVIAGAPNAGKSSLMNVLARRDVAIVSDEAGTTRDILTVHLDLEGYHAIVSDTAGIREATGVVEAEGVRRAQTAIEGADLVLHLVDMTAINEPPIEIPAGAECIVVGTKSDLADGGAGRHGIAISTVTGAGLPDLLSMIHVRIKAAAGVTAGALPTRRRQRRYLGLCLDHIDAVLGEADMPIEVKAEELRFAGDALGRLTGNVGVEELLGVIFSEFCIGK